jgi:uncharacterized protein (TIGR01777 family)
MRIIITGGTGLIGRALTASLAHDGHEVIVLSRNPTAVTNLPGGARAEKWDGQSAQGWGQLADGTDAIVNLAGATISKRWSESYKQEILNSRLQASQAVVAAIKTAAKKPGVLIQSSAVGYYGPRGSEEITEEAKAGSDFLAKTCVAWEASTAEVESMGVRRVIIRTGVVLDKTGGALPQMMLPVKLFVGGPLGGGRQYFPWIHLEDEVAAIRFLIDNPTANGVYNLSAPNPQTNAAFTSVLGKMLGRPSFMPTPGFAMKALFGEMSTLVLDGQRQMPKRLLAAGFKFKFAESEAALRDVLK